MGRQEPQPLALSNGGSALRHHLGGPMFQLPTKLSHIPLLPPALQLPEATYGQEASSAREIPLCPWHLQARGQQPARRYLCWEEKRDTGRELSRKTSRGDPKRIKVRDG